MAKSTVGVAVVAVSLLCASVLWLIARYAHRQTRWLVLAVVSIGWLLPFSIALLLPLDLSSVRLRLSAELISMPAINKHQHQIEHLSKVRANRPHLRPAVYVCRRICIESGMGNYLLDIILSDLGGSAHIEFIHKHGRVQLFPETPVSTSDEHRLLSLCCGCCYFCCGVHCRLPFRVESSEPAGFSHGDFKRIRTLSGGNIHGPGLDSDTQTAVASR